MSAHVSRRRRAAGFGLVALATLAPAIALASAPAAGTGPCRTGGTLRDAGNGWLMMQPLFTVGGQQVTALASPPFDPNLMWATNGSQIVRTQDAGCTWAVTYRPSDSLGAPLSTTQITALAAPSSANQSSFLYVGITSYAERVPRPSVVVTTNRGRSWTTTASPGQSGLPPVGTVDGLTANAQVPQIAFAHVTLDLGEVRQSSVYATSDGGVTWARRTATTGSTDVTALRSHPLQTSTVFGIGGQGLAEVSTDGGATFHGVPGLGAPVTALDISQGAGGARLAAAMQGRPAVGLSGDGGHTWTSLPAPDGCSSVAVAPLQDIVAASDGLQLWFLSPTQRARPVGPVGASPLALSITAPTSAGFSVTGLRDGAVVRATFGLNQQVRRAAVPVLLLPTTPVTQFPATLTPQLVRLTLPVGGRARVPFRLLLPRTPTPVDVMFLVDTTGSMQPVIDSLRQGLAQIASTLQTSGLDVRFGVGDFRDYPSPRGAGQGETDSHPADWPYRLDKRIGPAGPALAEALASLRAEGGTSDGGQSALTALYQSTTGAGDLEYNLTFVPPGWEAGYRAASLKLAMVSTDTPPHYRGELVKNQENPAATVPNPGPGYDDVVREMRRHDVHQIGLAIDPGDGPSSRPALTRLAARTGAFAPAGGVDCNGDGTPDVAAGGALVCTVGSESTTAATGTTTSVSASSLAAAVISLAAMIPDLQPLHLQLAGGASYASVGTPARAVDLHADNELSYAVDVRCPAQSGGGTHRLEVAASTPARTVATAAIELACVPAVGGSFASKAAPLAGAAIAPAPAPPAANPLPNPNPNPAPNVNLNAAVAEQEQQQAQLAFAQADEGESQQLAMSRVRRRDDPAFVLGAALLLSGATLAAARISRRRVAPASTWR